MWWVNSLIINHEHWYLVIKVLSQCTYLIALPKDYGDSDKGKKLIIYSRAKRMNNNYRTRNGGDRIIPSARRSIHAHGNCPFSDKIVMGKYSLDTSPKSGECGAGSSPTKDQSVDEIDNVLSKFAHPSDDRSPSAWKGVHQQSSSSPVSAPYVVRRKSFDTSSPLHTDDSTDNVHKIAKSLPASLPPYLYYSEDDTYNTTPKQRLLFSNDRDRTGVQLESYLGTSYNRDQRYYNPNESNESNSPHNIPKNKGCQLNTEDNHITKVVLLIISCAVVVVTIWYSDWLNTLLETSSTNNIYDQPKFYNDINSLGDTYRISDDSILQVQTGISTIFEKQDAGSFIFAYNSGRNSFDHIIFYDFMDAVSSTAARYLRNESASHTYIAIDSSKLKMKTHSELINEFREDVTRTGVMLVRDLDKVPSTLAMAFHYYCDEYNPLVKKSAIFFTLDMAKCYNSSDKKQPTHSNIEKCLADKWNGVPEDNIKPLLTRVVGTIVDVTSV